MNKTANVVRSMTGFASLSGSDLGQDWTWDLKAVNGRGLDLRLRLPDRIDGLEAEVRKRAQAVVSRGNVTVSLRLNKADQSGATELDAARLSIVIDTLMQIEERARDAGLAVVPPSAADIAQMRGVMETATDAVDAAALKAILLQGFDAALADFEAMRRAEGAALATILGDQIDQIAALATRSRDEAAKRPEAQRDAMRRALAKLTDEVTGVDEARLSQELALLAIKTDVTEELDRLDAHVGAAREHLASGGAMGRKLDFLMQEFNREANTLCSKAQSPDLTAIGLELKAVIDQMREQVQNVE